MRYLLKMYREADPADEIAISAADDEEARELARIHLLMARGVVFAAAERDGHECFRIDRDASGTSF